VKTHWLSSPAALLGGIALLGAAACSGVFHSDAPATQVYVLRSKANPQADLMGRADVSLRVGRPIAGPGLNSDHIVLVQSDHRMSYYVASRWPAALPELIEAMTVDTLRSTGAWSTVQDSGSAFASDFILQIVIRRFEADYTENAGAPDIHVVLDCTVGRRAGREMLASFIAEGSASAGANRLTDVMSAFEEASNKALTAVAERTSQAVRGSLEHPLHPAQNVETPVPSITR
jgi:cholesterol transport system auxiliary component